jgi:hypothetical protein
MTCVGHYDIKAPIYKKNKSIRNNDMLEKWTRVFILSFSV